MESMDVALAEPEPVPAVSSTVSAVSFQKLLYVPGLFHILDGATHELLNHSLLWPEMKPLYENAVRFFHHGHYRRFFLQCCFDESQMQGWSFLFDDGPPLFEGGQLWVVLAEGVAWLLHRESVLQRTWAPEKLARRDADGAEAQDAEQQQQQQQREQSVREDTSNLVHKTTLALQNPLFWAFCKLINSLVEIVSALTAWAQACPCHPQPLRQHMQEVLGVSRILCPMRGLRLPEIVAGELGRLFEKQLAHQSCEMSLRLTAGLSEDQMSKARLDWSRLKGQLKMQLEFKLTPFVSLPLSILGLGHWDVNKSRELMWRAAAEYESLSPAEANAAHPLTKTLFAGDGRTELVKFLQGEAIESLPCLLKIRLKARWCPVLEQTIEREHAQLHARIKAAPNHSPPYVSLTERGPELTELMRSDASVIGDLSRICADIRQPSLVAKALGLSAHPAFRRAALLSPDKQLSHRLVAACVYRADPETQYASIDASAVSGLKPPPNPSPFKGQAGDGSDDDVQGVVKPDSGSAEVGGDVAQTWKVISNNMTFKHFAATANAADFFSVPTEIVNSPGHPGPGQSFLALEDITRPSAKNVPERMLKQVMDLGVSHAGALALPSSSNMNLTFEEDSGVIAEAQPGLQASDREALQDMLCNQVDEQRGAHGATDEEGPRGANAKRVFFRLLSSTIGSKKRSRTDRRINLDRNQFCVQRHEVHMVDVPAREVHVCLSSAGLGESNAETAVEVWQRPDSIRMFLKWKVQRHYHVLKGPVLSPEAQEAFELLLKHHGVDPNLNVDSSNSTEGVQRGLLQLAALNIASCVCEGDQFCVWSFTDTGKQKVVENVVLGSAVNASHPRTTVPLEDQTVIELLGLLKQHGWVLCVEANKAVEPAPCRIVNGKSDPNTKFIYARPGQRTVMQPYLVCLAKITCASSDASPILGSEIRHFQIKAYYLELLGKEVKVRAKKHSMQMLQDSGLDQCALEIQPSTKRQKREPKAIGAGLLPLPAPAEEDREQQESARELVSASVVEPPESRMGQPSTKESPVMPSEAPPPPPPPAAKASVKRSRQEKTFEWGPALITFKPPRIYQATCHRVHSHKHELGHSARCTRARAFHNPEGETMVLRELKHWLNIAGSCATRMEHMNSHLSVPVGPDADDILEAARVDAGYETDFETEEGHAQAPASGAASGAAVAKAVAAPKRRFRSKTHVPADDAPATAAAKPAVASASGASSSDSSSSSSELDSSSSSDSSS